MDHVFELELAAVQVATLLLMAQLLARGAVPTSSQWQRPDV
jgi:hypothetical protein